MERVFILWNNSYSVGVERIDNQHKRLIDILNKLYESFIDQTAGHKLEIIINELIDYTDYHFAAEEKLFEKLYYQGKEKHIEEHQGFIKKIKAFKKELEENESGLTFQLMNFLRNWLINHIAVSDQAYASHFRTKGIN